MSAPSIAPEDSKIDYAVDFIKDKWSAFSNEHSTAINVTAICLGVVVAVLWIAIILNKHRRNSSKQVVTKSRSDNNVRIRRRQ